VRPLSARSPIRNTGLSLPRIVFGTSSLGNLYRPLNGRAKRAILRECMKWVSPPVVLDSAGKYGAGLALEVIGRELRNLGVPGRDVLISNKLGWYRVALRAAEPTFEPGVWKNIAHDADQRIGRDAILACWDQGRRLLGAPYVPAMVSVHDPDEYLAAARSPTERRARREDILGAYAALLDLRRRGAVKAVGVGAKDWRVVRWIAERVDLDWVMLALSLTLLRHPPPLLRYVDELAHRGVAVINSAVFHGGFLCGGAFFDYRKIDPAAAADRALLGWRERFLAVCREEGVGPAKRASAPPSHRRAS